MAKTKSAGLASIFDDEPEPAAQASPETAPEAPGKGQERALAGKGGSPLRTQGKPATRTSEGKIAASTRAGRKDSHPGKKPVLIHIPEDMHRILRQLSVEEGGEPITQVTERGLRQYLVQRGYTKFAGT